MRIEFVEIGNFRKLLSTRVGFSSEKTVFVGANNSGKTSAITALRYFLVGRERSSFCFNDFTLAHWPAINAMGAAWEAAHGANQPLPEPEWDPVLPFLDVWLQVAEDEGIRSPPPPKSECEAWESACRGHCERAFSRERSVAGSAALMRVAH